jgi:hypothetical protein
LLVTFASPGYAGKAANLLPIIFGAKMQIEFYGVFKNKTGMGAVADVYRAGIWLISYSQHDWYADTF